MTKLSFSESFALPSRTSVRLENYQKYLLRELVNFVKAGKLKEPIVPFPLREPSTHYAIYLRGEPSFKFKRISDMDALCDADYLSFHWNRVGTTKLYNITKAGFRAIEYGFDTSPIRFGANTNLSEIVTAMSGGVIHVKGLAEHLDLIDIATDPLLRHDSVQLLIRALLAEAEASLPWKTFLAYSKTAVQFETELLRAKTDPSALAVLAATLTLSHDPSLPLPFTVKALAFVYPLLLIGHLFQ